MSVDSTGEGNEIAAYVVELEAEVTRLRQVEAAAREARAFLEGRRPGFASTYALDVLRAALSDAAPETDAFPVVRGGWNARRKTRRPR
jgi:hypothetical protein